MIPNVVTESKKVSIELSYGESAVLHNALSYFVLYARPENVNEELILSVAEGLLSKIPTN